VAESSDAAALPHADVALLTERRYTAPVAAADDWYLGNILGEDDLLIAALAKRGLSAARIDWSRLDVDWSAFRVAVFRTTWDYFDRFAEFTAWLERVEPLVAIAGRVTHGLRKRARPGDFRVQDDHGGTLHPLEPSAAQVALAERALAACDTLPAYGRVDMVRLADGSLAVMELELVEPELWLRLHPPAAEALAAAVADAITAP